MSDLIKYGAIGIGGYFVLKYVFGIDLLTSFETPVSTGTASTPQAANPTNAATAASQATTLAAMKTLMAASGVGTGLTNVDTWNYYYNKVRGIAGPAPEDLFPGVDRNKLYSLDEWWTAM